MKLANIQKTYIILRHGKWDIPAYFGDGKMLDMHLAYLMMDLPFGVPYTLDHAYSFIEDALVALGFPDSIIQPDDAFVKLLAKQEESNADIGLFPAMCPHKNEMVEINDNGQIRSIQINHARTQLLYAWEIAIWTPVFTRFMHDYVSARKEIGDKYKIRINQDEQNELQVGDVIKAAIPNDMNVASVLFKDGSCLDIGTPEDMIKAIQDTI